MPNLRRVHAETRRKPMSRRGHAALSASFTFRATALPTTEATSSSVAAATARREPKRSSRARWRAGPTPGMVESSERMVRFVRSFRL